MQAHGTKVGSRFSETESDWYLPGRSIAVDQQRPEPRITSNPRQCRGRPCIRGTRIRVTDVLGMLADGVTEERILVDFPDLEAEDIRACLLFAAKRANHVA